MSKIGHFDIIARFTKLAAEKLQENFFFAGLDDIFKKRAYEEVDVTSAKYAYWRKSSLKYSYCPR